MPRQNAAHTRLVNDILLEFGSRPDMRIFQNRTGMGWAGEIRKQGKNVLVINAHPIYAGLATEGSADLIAIVHRHLIDHPRVVGIPERVTGIGEFCSIEVKTGEATEKKHQTEWSKMVRAMGGTAGAVWSIQDVYDLLRLEPLK